MSYYPAAVTRLTNLLNIRTPLLVPPMFGVSGGALAAQVTNGGGLGFLSHGYISELPLARSLLHSKPQEGGPLPIGVGYLGWMLDKLSPKESESILDTALASNVQAHWFAFGNDLGKYIRYIREKAPQQGSTKNPPPAIIVLVNSVEEAVRAVEEFKADIIVAQGLESGGHGGGYAPPLSELLQGILSRFAASSSPHGVPIVLAAGGLVNGADIASQIAKGASGVVMGTRFLLTPENKYTDAQREALIAARSEDTVRTMAFDHARGTLEWPKGVDGRALRNDTVSDFEQGVNLEVLQAKYKEGIQNQDRNRFLVWAGTGVGLMNRIVPAKELVQELHAECETHLKSLAAKA